VSTPSFLIRSDRRWDGYLTSLTVATDAVLTPEYGEGFRVIRCDDGVLKALDGTGLLQFILPIERSFDWREPPASMQPSPHWAELLSLISAHSLRAASVFSIRRYGLIGAKAAEERLAPYACASDDLNELRLIVVYSDQKAFAGISTLASSRLPLIDPERLLTEGDAPSRAGDKFSQALEWLRCRGIDHRTFPHWLELGAFPGGITTRLVGAGHSVDAVDLVAPTEQMLGLKGVRHLTSDLFSVAMDRKVDAVFCDINGPAEKIARGAARLMTHLSPGGLLIHTIKLTRRDDVVDVRRFVASLFAEVQIREIGVQHLPQNRQEITFFGVKAEDL